jgi:NADPH-dependent 2,4-dienoyl-CoA reductase/sulfur reductase-like enzyme
MSTPMRDVAVIGAGPAGLAAATLLAEQGLDVVLLDEQEAPGGQIYRGIERSTPALSHILGGDYAHGASLAAALRASSAAYRPRTAVWQVTPEREIWMTSSGRSELVTARAIIVATGALERPVPVPGWTLPGVMTAGAVQIALKTAALAPEGLVLAGSGPLLYLLGAQCITAGAPPAALIDTTSRENEQAAIRYAAALLHGEARRMVRKGLALKAAIRKAGVPIWRYASDLRIEGDGRAQRVSFSSGGRCHVINASLVALHEGVIPHQQMTRAIGCAHQWDAGQRCFRPVLDQWGNTSVAGILVAGDGGGIGGAVAAEHAGRLAALEVLHQLGRLPTAERDRRAIPHRRAHAAQLALRPLLDALYAPREEILRPADEVVVCRCEEVTAGRIREAARQGAQGPNQVKAFLRAGMGPCQGRICGPAVTEIMAGELARDPEAIGYYRIRPPIKPITIGELAALDPLA